MRRLAVLVATAVLLLSCGSDDGPNQADTAFATAMIEHHAEGIAMANTTIGREGLKPAIADFAERLRLDMTAEIDRLAVLLEDWGEPVPRTGFGTGDGHTHAEAGHDVVEALAGASDTEFERRWLTAMVEHHEAGIAMVRDIADEGESPVIAEGAQQLADGQRAEIQRLRRWLRTT